MLPPAPASCLLHSLLQRLVARRGRRSPGPTQGACMCSRPPLPALTGASLCWGGLRGKWGGVYADELQPPQDPREVFRGKLGRVHADRSPGLLRIRGESSGRCGSTSTLTGALSHLRTHREASGRCGSTSTLTGAPEPLQDLQGGFRKMWCHVHSSRSSRAPQDIS